MGKLEGKVSSDQHTEWSLNPGTTFVVDIITTARKRIALGAILFAYRNSTFCPMTATTFSVIMGLFDFFATAAQYENVAPQLGTCALEDYFRTLDEAVQPSKSGGS